MWVMKFSFIPDLFDGFSSSILEKIILWLSNFFFFYEIQSADSIIPFTLCLLTEKGLSKVSMFFIFQFILNLGINLPILKQFIGILKLCKHACSLEYLQWKDWTSFTNYQLQLCHINTNAEYYNLFGSIQFVLVNWKLF